MADAGDERRDDKTIKVASASARHNNKNNRARHKREATSRERFFEFDYSPHACNCMRVECEYCPPAGAPTSSSS